PGPKPTSAKTAITIAELARTRVNRRRPAGRTPRARPPWVSPRSLGPWLPRAEGPRKSGLPPTSRGRAGVGTPRRGAPRPRPPRHPPPPGERRRGRFSPGRASSPGLCQRLAGRRPPADAEDVHRPGACAELPEPVADRLGGNLPGPPRGLGEL